MEPMEISFIFDKEDWVAFHRHHLSAGRNAKKMRRKSMLTGAAAGVLFLMFLLWGGGDVFSLVIVLVLFMGLSFSIPYFRRRRLVRAAEKAAEKDEVSRNFGPQQVLFSEESIVNKMPIVESKLKWSGVVGCEQNEEYFFLYTSPTTAIVIPKQKIDTDLAALDALLSEKTASKTG